VRKAVPSLSQQTCQPAATFNPIDAQFIHSVQSDPPRWRLRPMDSPHTTLASTSLHRLHIQPTARAAAWHSTQRHLRQRHSFECSLIMHSSCSLCNFAAHAQPAGGRSAAYYAVELPLLQPATLHPMQPTSCTSLLLAHLCSHSSLLQFPAQSSTHSTARALRSASGSKLRVQLPRRYRVDAY
jgi:hypothetical protein